MKDFLNGKKAALIDMDGVLYDSMKYHTLAWYKLAEELGVPTPRDEFYLYEGMTGAATLDRLFMKKYDKPCPPEKIEEFYRRKTELFRDMGRMELMPGAAKMLKGLKDAGIRCVLVTGSGQKSLIDQINQDYPGIFLPGDMVTGNDVEHGKPHPEPYLRGLKKAGVEAEEAIVIENAPLGVRAGKAAGVFTVAVTTGPIPREAFLKEKADMIFPDMPAFADAVVNATESGS